MSDESRSIGAPIQMRRNTLGFSQAELAKKLGVTTAYVSKIESGSTPPSDELCKKIAAVLELNDLETRSLRASALQERSGIKVEEICPHVETTGKKEIRSNYELTLMEAIRRLDDRQRSEILDWILWQNQRQKSKSTEQRRQESIEEGNVEEIVGYDDTGKPLRLRIHDTTPSLVDARNILGLRDPAMLRKAQDTSMVDIYLKPADKRNISKKSKKDSR